MRGLKVQLKGQFDPIAGLDSLLLAYHRLDGQDECTRLRRKNRGFPTRRADRRHHAQRAERTEAAAREALYAARQLLRQRDEVPGSLTRIEPEARLDFVP